MLPSEGRTWLRRSPVCWALATVRPKAKAITAITAAFIAKRPKTFSRHSHTRHHWRVGFLSKKKRKEKRKITHQQKEHKIGKGEKTTKTESREKKREPESQKTKGKQKPNKIEIKNGKTLVQPHTLKKGGSIPGVGYIYIYKYITPLSNRGASASCAAAHRNYLQQYTIRT